MSSALRACRFLLAPSKSAVSSASSTASKAKRKPKPKGEAKTSRQPGGLQKLVPVSPILASFVGSSECTRAKAVKQVWAHIKVHNLQDSANKKEIHCDSKLKSLFGGKVKVNFLEIAGLLNHHFVKTD